MVSETTDAESPDVGEKAKRERSTIEFPYSDLNSAIEIARTIHDRAGTSCEVNQLAGWLDQSPTGGTFRSRLSAARIFGLIETGRGGQATLVVPLGRDILDENKERTARIEVFLTVPLYEAMYERLKGYALPPAAAIERQMAELGVSSKQVERARQIFTKSAHQAQFIDQQTGRFIKPSAGGAEPPPPANEQNKGGKGGNGNGGDDMPPDVDPIVAGLLARLPKAGSIWPEQDRELWLELLKGSFKLIYKDKSADGAKPLSGEPLD